MRFFFRLALIFSLIFSLVLCLFIACFTEDNNGDVIAHLDEDYNKAVSLEMGYLSDYAYIQETSKKFDPAEFRKALKAKISAQPSVRNYEVIWVGVFDHESNLVYVLKHKEGKQTILSIVFRGTVYEESHFVRDVMEDVSVGTRVSWSNAHPSAKISLGISEALQFVAEMTSPVYGGVSETPIELAVSLKELIRQELENVEDAKIYLTGHSLGGALATAYALFLAEEYTTMQESGALKIIAYDIAGQTVGNEAFTAYYSELLNDTKRSFSYHRVVNTGDILPYFFNNVMGILEVYTYSTLGRIAVKGALEGSITVLDLTTDPYRHIPVVPKTFDTFPDVAEKCGAEVESFSDLTCKAFFYHASTYYISLLKSDL